METPDDLRYTDDDLWLAGDGRLGVTDFAQDQLGEVVYLELPDIGSRWSVGQAFGVIESAKAVIDLASPVAGIVIARNDDAVERPEIVNESPYGDGWLLQFDVSSVADGLLTATAYAASRPVDD